MENFGEYDIIIKDNLELSAVFFNILQLYLIKAKNQMRHNFNNGVIVCGDSYQNLIIVKQYLWEIMIPIRSFLKDRPLIIY